MFVVPFPRHAHPFNRALEALLSEGAFERCAAAAATPAESDEPRIPTLEVSESDQAYTVTLVMPGVAKDEIKVAVDGRQVSVDAKATNKGTEAAAKEGERIVYRETTASRAAPRYARRFTLPQELDQTVSAAKLEHGVLTLTLAKRLAAQATQITVN